MMCDGFVDDLFVLETAADVIVSHRDDGGCVGEEDRPVFSIIGHLPDAGGCFKQGLITVRIKFRGEVFDRINRIDAGVLI